jgi:hypothetical protein
MDNKRHAGRRLFINRRSRAKIKKNGSEFDNVFETMDTINFLFLSSYDYQKDIDTAL